ncbi:MAG TPA: histidine phosphatase family protein [Candidatus Thermoplasmatota archaeon]|nr:histidine phosphatase family protein [Candidatus Thermoplasmatota archaeon]
MRLHIVRHGETRHNLEGRIQGDLLDDDLTEVGHAQAEALRRHYAHERERGLVAACVYTSPLLRARSTARRIAEGLDLPAPTELPGMREVSWGEHMGKLNEGETRADMERVLRSWDEGRLDARAPGGETPHDAWTRAMRDLAPVLERHADDTVILVGHGRINKIVTSGLLHGDLAHMEAYPQANAGITILEGPDPWRVVAPNRTQHLVGLRALEERVS